MKRMMTVTLAGCLLFTGCTADSGNRGESETSAGHTRSDEPAAAKKEHNTADRAASSTERSVPAPGPRPAPPNGEPYDSMYFDHAGTNPFVATEEDPLSTFAIDVDTASYSIVRNYLANGSLPPQDAVRVEEFVNAFNPSYPAPTKDALQMYADGGPSPFGTGYELVRIGLKGKNIQDDERLPANLTFVIDVSGSMDRDNRLGLVKQSLSLLIDSLHPSDQLAIVVYGTDARVVLEPTSLEEKQSIEDAINGLAPSGSTNAEQGLKMAYELAERQYSKDTINRVILCSDGVANLGETSAEGLLRSIEDYAGKDITLTTVGFGMGNFNDVLMEQLANQGDGVYAYVDSFTEARRLFVENLAGTLQTVARDAKIQVEFDPAYVDRYRLIGYENRDLLDEDFRDDEKDAGEVGAGHTVTALYEVKLIEDTVDARNRMGTATLRYVDEATKKTEERSISLRTGVSLSTELKFLASVAEYAELLRGSYWAKDGSIEEVLTLAEQSAKTEREQQFVTLVKDTAALQR